MREISGWEKTNTVATVVLALFAGFALWYAHGQIKEAREESHNQIQESREQAKIEHLTEVVRDYDSPYYLDMRRRLAVKRIDIKKERLCPLRADEPPAEMVDLLDYYQHIGILVDRGYLDVEDVYSDFSDDMFRLYTDGKPLIDLRQKEQKAVWGAFTKLMDQLIKVNQRDNGGAGYPPDQDEIYQEYYGDTDIVSGSPMPKSTIPPCQDW